MSGGQEDLNAPADMKEVIDEKQGSILLSLIKQLRIGMDLTRVTLPTFILEPRSFLERMSDFMIHKNLILSAPLIDDPVERFVAVIRWFLAGWHHKPKGVKKPYNPVLGEEFHAQWRDDKFGTLKLVAEQVTHHPPVSAVYFEDRKAHFCMNGHIYTRSKFMGNSVACIMEGQMQIYFTNRDAEEYTLTLPTAYARGVIFGTLIMEIGDKVQVECKRTGMLAEIDFRTKGFFSGDYNEIRGTIKKDGKPLFHLHGKWDDKVYLKAHHSKEQTLLFDVRTLEASKMIVAPIEEQKEYESRRMWQKVTAALLDRDFDTATVHKTALEDAQRARRKEMEEQHQTYEPKYFVLDEQKRWRYKWLNTKPYDPSEDSAAPADAAAAASQ